MLSLFRIGDVFTWTKKLKNIKKYMVIKNFLYLQVLHITNQVATVNGFF